MNDSLGRRLRRERERQGISLASIATETKISAALLEALERDDLSNWPPGIFRRSFVRSYADAIGVDAHAVVEEFLQKFSEADNFEQASDHLLTPMPLRLTLADDAFHLYGMKLASEIRRSWRGVAWDLGTVLIIGAFGFLAVGEFWMTLAATSLLYFAGGVLLLGNTPGVVLFTPQILSRESGHLRLLVGNAASAEAEPQALTLREDELQDLALHLEASEEAAEQTRRAAG